jgi:hypothetical protein
LAQAPGHVLNWLDAALPKRATAAMVPYADNGDFSANALLWWDVEFWNQSIVREYVAANRLYSYAGFPDRMMRPNWATGRVPGTADAPPYLVVSLHDTRFQFQGSVLGIGIGLFPILATDRPYRAVWLSKSLYPDGWTYPGRAATFRFYSQDRYHAHPFVAVIPLTAPPTTRARYRIQSASGTRSAVIPAGGTTTESLEFCVPAGSFADVVLTTKNRARIRGAPTAWEVTAARFVGVHVGAIGTQPLTTACR